MAEDLDACVMATGLDKRVYQRIQEIYKTFQAVILSSTPAFEVNGKLIALQDDGLATKRVTMQEVKELRQRHLGYELPSFSPYSAVKELLRTTTGTWKKDMLACFDDILAELQSESRKVLNEHFARFPGMHQASYEGVSIPASAVPGILCAFGLNFKDIDELYLAQVTDVEDELNMMAASLAYRKVLSRRLHCVPLLVGLIAMARASMLGVYCTATLTPICCSWPSNCRPRVCRRATVAYGQLSG
eukprot:361712-Chlamydomonas_euryale.AAC.2